MHISRFRIRNYKSFNDSGDIYLSPDFNVVVGPNNAGKTALIEALSLQFTDKPHRSQHTAPYPTTTLTGKSTVEVTFEIERAELSRLLGDTGKQIHVPREQVADADAFVTQYMAHDAFSVMATYTDVGSTSFSMSGLNLRPVIEGEDNSTWVYGFDPATGELSFVNHGHAVPQSTFPSQLPILLRQRPFLIKAQRQIPGSATIGAATELAPEGDNLASVIHRLKNLNPGRWSRYLQQVREVLPEIQDISLDFPTSNQAQIRLWSLDPATERSDLSISLDESGTGIGQVLAILFVAVASEVPRILIIDEPQSFLHPGAIRNVMEILKSAPMQHQYVITTHSPTVINAAEPSLLLGLRKVEFESQVSSIDLTVQHEVQDFLAHIGARLSDVFGMDQILWVEGPTEEVSIPKIIKHFNLVMPRGLSVMGVIGTGDFDGHRKELILDIYNRLSGQTALMSPALAFVFDSENRTVQQKRDLEGKGKGLVRFLPRRMYENYLLNPTAIAALLTELVLECEIERNEVLPAEVAEWLEAHQWDAEFIGAGDRSNERWLVEVNGARLLGAITSHFTERTVNYADYKVEFGRRLTELMLEHSPAEFDELVEVLRSTLQIQRQG